MKLQLRKLKHLELAQISQVSDSLAIDIARHCKHLETLNLSLCTNITDKTVEYLARHSKQLRHLYLVSCKITNQGTGQVYGAWA